MIQWSVILPRKHLSYAFKKVLVRYFSNPNVAAKRLEKLREMAKPLTRSDPVILKLDTPVFKSIFTDELNSLSELFTKNGFEIRIAGGAVRDLLMDIKPSDVDLATTATPEQMKEMFTNENIRMINMQGEKHGTITPRINNKENFEVTTLRIDVLTDGRHAEVQFTTDWLLDANRRDLTINSMFLGLDGSVYDYFYGYEDLQKRRIAFVGNAVTRIQEDYLRILRYFRFFGRISNEPNAHEEETLKAIKENAGGLAKISGERIWMELKKILQGNYAGVLLQLMVELELCPYIGLPTNPNLKELKTVWERSKHQNMHAITLLSTLITNESEAMDIHARIKLSAFERDLLLFIVKHREIKLHPKALLPYQQLVLKSKFKTSDCVEWVKEVLKYNNSPHLQDFCAWKIPKFPITGGMLKEQGVESGKFMGLVMNELKDVWIDSEFSLTVDQLLQQLPHVVGLLQEKRKK